MPLSNGHLLENRYKIETTLTTKGGMGVVYCALDTRLQIPVAIKENLFATPEAEDQFRAEARLLAQLSHPNLPNVSDHFFAEGKQYLTMDFIEGEDLYDRVTRLGALTEAEVLPWMLKICSALSYLHSQSPPIIHRDIKPHNIKVRPDNQVFLVDFGIAKVYNPDSSTSTGAKGISSGYSPTEQRLKESTDTRSDIYALGATLYHLLTGQKPQDSLKLYKEDLTPPYNLNPQISPAVERAILRAMALDKTQRFQTIEEFEIALQQTGANVSSPIGTAPPPTPSKPAPKQPQPKTPTPQPLSKSSQTTPKPVITFDNLVQQFETQIRQVCHSQARYRVLWLVGKPGSGKTLLAKAVCKHTDWKYINFTLDTGYLDGLKGQEYTFVPENFINILQSECQSSTTEVIILDEIEPLLGWWTWDEQEIFFKAISKATRLKCGIVLATRLRTVQQLAHIAPGKQHIFEIPEGVEL